MLLPVLKVCRERVNFELSDSVMELYKREDTPKKKKTLSGQEETINAHEVLTIPMHCNMASLSSSPLRHMNFGPFRIQFCPQLNQSCHIVAFIVSHWGHNLFYNYILSLPWHYSLIQPFGIMNELSPTVDRPPDDSKTRPLSMASPLYVMRVLSTSARNIDVGRRLILDSCRRGRQESRTKKHRTRRQKFDKPSG